MLEFIVLGQIPGTSFVLTFQWIAAIATVVFGGAALRYAHKHQATVSAQPIEEITL